MSFRRFEPYERPDNQRKSYELDDDEGPRSALGRSSYVRAPPFGSPSAAAPTSKYENLIPKELAQSAMCHKPFRGDIQARYELFLRIQLGNDSPLELERIYASFSDADVDYELESFKRAAERTMFAPRFQPATFIEPQMQAGLTEFPSDFNMRRPQMPPPPRPSILSPEPVIPVERGVPQTVTRTVTYWHPSAELCIVLNVPQPQLQNKLKERIERVERQTTLSDPMELAPNLSAAAKNRVLTTMFDETKTLTDLVQEMEDEQQPEIEIHSDVPEQFGKFHKKKYMEKQKLRAAEMDRRVKHRIKKKNLKIAEWQQEKPGFAPQDVSTKVKVKPEQRDDSWHRPE